MIKKNVCSFVFAFFLILAESALQILNEMREQSTIISSSPKPACAEVAYVLLDYNMCFR